MTHKIAVVHYLPLEFYPPVTNFIDSISKEKEINVHVYSSVNNKKREEYTNSEVENIYRSPSPKSAENAIIRLIKYFIFNISVFFRLCINRPDTVLYYETFSVLPVYWYFKYINKKAKLFIHYHEYFSKDWYAKGMKTLQYYHKLEEDFLYEKSTYITQTNFDRIKLFLKDCTSVKTSKMGVLPNYPPKSWYQNLRIDKNTDFVKSVYVGSLSLETMYVKEYCDWVQAQNGKVTFDIYGYNVAFKTDKYLKDIKSEYINYFPGGMEYNQIPELLSKYNVGVILYKALIENFKYNAPNKLFEYISANLEIWYSDKMLGIKPYDKKSYPRILPVNFDEIDKFDLLNETNVPYEKHNTFIAEDIYSPYIKKLTL